jgi:ankyrin repeat protein
LLKGKKGAENMLDMFIQSLLNRDLETANRELAAGATVDRKYGKNGWTALHYLAENGVLESAGWLLDHGANPNEKDSFGVTPLHLAIDSEADTARQRYVVTGEFFLSGKMIQLLLAHGADPNATTDEGKTPLGFAMSCGHTVAANILSEYGGRE